MNEERTLRRNISEAIKLKAEERQMLTDPENQPHQFKSSHDYTANDCSDSERAFLNAIRENYVRFRKEYYKNDSGQFEIDDPVELYLTFSDDILEGDDLLIDDLEHVIRAWEEELKDAN